MRMHTEEGPDAAKPSENGEQVKPGAEARPDSSIIQKYRGLKSKLKYLIYEHRCFEHELNRAQTKLLDLSREKTVLLDELLHYEPVSGDDEELTDASGDETGPVYKPVPSKQVGEGSRSPQPPASGGPAKPSQLTKQGIAKASAIINSVSNNIAAKVTKTGTKRQARTSAKPGTSGGGTATKISKVVSRVRQNNPPQHEGVVVTGGVAVPNSVSHGAAASNKKLVVSYPINSIAADTPSSTTASSSSIYSTKTTPLAPPPTTTIRNKTTTTTRAVKRPIPALTKAQTHQAPPPPSTTSSLHSSTLLVSSMGSVHVTTISAPSTTTSSSSSSASKPPPPPLIPTLIPDSKPSGNKGHGNGGRSSSTSSTSSSSSSNSDSGSGSDASSGSEDEAMETDAHNQNGGGGGGGSKLKGGPVQIVSTVKSSSNLPRPKAILSPIKMAPTLLVSGMTAGGGGGVPATPPGQVMVMSPQPAFTNWTAQSQPGVAEIGSPVSGAVGTEGAPGVVGFLPALASPLSSPSPSATVLPFSSSLNRPGSAGGSGSAFQVFSPKHHHHHHMTTPPNSTPSSAPATTASLSQHTSPLSLQSPKVLPTPTNSNTNSSSANV